MNFCKDRIGYFADTGHVILIFILIFQTIFLIFLGNTVKFRILGSLIAPLLYTIVEFKLDFQFILNSAHIFFWVFSILIGIIQALQIKATSLRIKKINEALITSLNMIMFVFIYFYFDLHMSNMLLLEKGLITEAHFNQQLKVLHLITNIVIFFQEATHIYIIIGGILLATSIAVGRIEILKLNEKIKGLFGKYVDTNVRDKILAEGIGTSEKKNSVFFFMI